MSEKPQIVAGIDGSESSLKAARWAIRQAQMTDSKVLIVMAWEVSWWVNVNPVTNEGSYAEMAQQIFEHALEQLELGEAGIEVETQLIQMKPGLALEKLSENASLLVLSGQGHGNVPGAHLGSVSGYCAHHAKCPVLIHRA